MKNCGHVLEGFDIFSDGEDQSVRGVKRLS